MSMVGLMNRVLLFAVCLGLASTAVGQDQPAPKATKPAATTPEGKEFQELYAGREVLGKKLEKLQAEISAAGKAKDLKQQQALINQFNGLITEFKAKSMPRLVALAGPLYLKDAGNADAESVVLGNLEELFSENKYKEVIAEGPKYIEAGRKHPLILNFVGVAYFATHDFVKAEATLRQAKAATKDDELASQMYSQIGAPYLDQCQPYQAMWKKEQAIRAKEAAAKGDARLPRILFKVTRDGKPLGDIELELFENEAPNTVANFVSLVEKKYYDGIGFHRVIRGFMAQGGDPNTKDQDPRNDGMGGPGYHIKCECYQADARIHFQGSLSMAKTAEPDTGGSQFFLTHLPTAHLNADVEKQSGHTVFGRIVKGLDIALGIHPGDRIQSATVLFKRNHPYVPQTIGE